MIWYNQIHFKFSTSIGKSADKYYLTAATKKKKKKKKKAKFPKRVAILLPKFN